MTVAAICTRAVDTIEPKDSLRLAARRMLQRNVGALVVLAAGREPLGIVTDRDIVLKGLARDRDVDGTTVGEVMTLHPEVVEESTPVTTALAVMRAGGFRRLPVVDDAGQVAGIVSLDDMIPWFGHAFGIVEDLLAHAGPRILDEPRSRDDSDTPSPSTSPSP